MRIIDLLAPESISLDAAPKTKQEALDEAVRLMAQSGKINDEEAYRKQVYAREEEGTTGIGEGIAIPHGRCEAVSRPGLAAMVIRDGVDFDSLDGQPVHLLFLIAAPNTKDNVHLDVLSKLSVLLMDEELTRKLTEASSTREFLELLNEADEEKGALPGTAGAVEAGGRGLGSGAAAQRALCAADRARRENRARKRRRSGHGRARRLRAHLSPAGNASSAIRRL